jgi:hypothetical protein
VTPEERAIALFQASSPGDDLTQFPLSLLGSQDGLLGGSSGREFSISDHRQRGGIGVLLCQPLAVDFQVPDQPAHRSNVPSPVVSVRHVNGQLEPARIVTDFPEIGLL